MIYGFPLPAQAHLRVDVATWCSCWTGPSATKPKDGDRNTNMDSHIKIKKNDITKVRGMRLT